MRAQQRGARVRTAARRRASAAGELQAVLKVQAESGRTMRRTRMPQETEPAFVFTP
jgi:hypothetical protein